MMDVKDFILKSSKNPKNQAKYEQIARIHIVGVIDLKYNGRAVAKATVVRQEACSKKYRFAYNVEYTDKKGTQGYNLFGTPIKTLIWDRIKRRSLAPIELKSFGYKDGKEWLGV